MEKLEEVSGNVRRAQTSNKNLGGGERGKKIIIKILGKTISA